MPAWNPDDGTALTKPAITCTAVEKSALDLWAEFLTGWFDGTAHLLRGVTETTLPKVDAITFQDTALPTTLDGLYLTITTDKAKNVRRMPYSSETYMVHERTRVNFWFRANVKTRRTDGHNSHSLVTWGADTLYAILQSITHTAVLQGKGMHTLRPQPPVLISTMGSAAGRHIALDVTYIYSSQETVDGVTA